MPNSKRPHILILNPDQMRADALTHLGCGAIETQHMDALARDGVSFSRAFCQNPVCTPSRCSFMSGWYPHVAGHRTMKHMMQPHEPVLLKELKDNGYHVWMNMRNDLLPAQRKNYTAEYCDSYFIPDKIPSLPLKQAWRGSPEGEDYYGFLQGKIEPQRDMDQLCAEGAAAFIREYRENRPFCIYLPFMFPHPPYACWDPYYSAVDAAKIKPFIEPPPDFSGKSRMVKALHHAMRLDRWDDAKFNELRRVYLAMCLRTDDLVGIVINALKERGLYEDTAIFLFSDHGDYTGDYRMTEKQQNAFEDCLCNVPFIVKLPQGMQKRCGVSEELTELVDFYATAADIAQLPPTHTHFGLSLRPYIGRECDSLRDAVFCEGGFRTGEMQCVYSETEQFPKKSDLYYPRIALQMDDEAQLNGKAIMCRTKEYKYIRRLYEPDELYDLRCDPDEVHNVAQEEGYRGILEQMRDRLLTHFLDTGDAVPFTRDRRFDAAVVPKVLGNTVKRSLGFKRKK